MDVILLGVVPTNVEAELIDVAAAAGHKWLLSPEVSVFYLSDRARERIQPTLVDGSAFPILRITRTSNKDGIEAR